MVAYAGVDMDAVAVVKGPVVETVTTVGGAVVNGPGVVAGATYTKPYADTMAVAEELVWPDGEADAERIELKLG